VSHPKIPVLALELIEATVRLQSFLAKLMDLCGVRLSEVQ
jgi:hypothetical protein